MKKTAKKLLALLLALVMTVPMMVTGVTAETSDATETSQTNSSGKIFLDFDSQSDFDNYLYGEIASGTPEVVVKDGFLQFQSTGNESYLFTAKHLVDVTYFTIEFDMMIQNAIPEKDADAYIGFNVWPYSKTNSGGRNLLNYASQFVMASNTNTLDSLQVYPETYHFEITRRDTVMYYTLKNSSGNVIGSQTVNNISGLSSPWIRLIAGNNDDKAFENVLFIDNMTISNPDEVTEDFESLKAENLSSYTGNATNTRRIGAISNYSLSSSFVSEIKKEENGNQYLHVSASKASNCYFYPDGFDVATAYTMTYDFKYIGTPIENDTQGYFGVNIHHKIGATSGGDGIAYYNCPSSNQVGLKAINSQLYISNFRPNVWYSFKMIRNGTNVDYYIWEKGAEGGIATAAHAVVGGAGTEAGVPTLRLLSQKVNAEFCFDNFSVKSLDATVKIAGVQASTEIDENDTYAVRMIAAVDSNIYKNAGFAINATYTNSEGQKVKRTFEEFECNYYTSITAYEDYKLETYTADDFGGKFLLALSIYGIPVDAGDIQFEIVAKMDVPERSISPLTGFKVPQYYTESFSFYADVADTKDSVTLVKGTLA
ncbi:MAG: hypothetical protein IKC59_07860 [Clostridia bacterium]|nr:hypothetical protein [Clostridia bacterium]